MNTHDTPRPRGIRLERQDLNGHSVEELSDYLDAGRTPADDSIDTSPGCQIALDALVRLRALTPDLFATDTAAEPAPEENWVQRILAGIALDARAGRRIPLVTSAPHTDLGITEGAVRGQIRAAEQAVPGVLIGRCRFEGDVTVPGESVRIRVDVSVPYGEPIPELADRLRAEIAARLALHTTLNVAGIDITVRDIQDLAHASEDDQ